MKRTIGKPTYAFEARDYVVSLPVTATAYGHSTGTNPYESTKTGDPATKFSTGRSGPRKDLIMSINSTPTYFIWKTWVGERTNFPMTNQTSSKCQWTELGFSPLCVDRDCHLRRCHWVWFYSRIAPINATAECGHSRRTLLIDGSCVARGPTSQFERGGSVRGWCPKPCRTKTITGVWARSRSSNVALYGP